MRTWENLKASTRPTDGKDYKRRISRGFFAGLGVGAFFGGVSTVWIRVPYKPDIRPTTLAQSTRMIVRPAVLPFVYIAHEVVCFSNVWCSIRGSWKLYGISLATVRDKEDWWTYFVSGSAAGAVAGLVRGNVPDFFKLTFFMGAIASILESCRGYQGIGPTIDARYEKKSKVLPDPVPRSEMVH